MYGLLDGNPCVTLLCHELTVGVAKGPEHCPENLMTKYTAWDLTLSLP
jgi:hypothetical protein